MMEWYLQDDDDVNENGNDEKPNDENKKIILTNLLSSILSAGWRDLMWTQSPLVLQFLVSNFFEQRLHLARFAFSLL